MQPGSRPLDFVVLFILVFLAAPFLCLSRTQQSGAGARLILCVLSNDDGPDQVQTIVYGPFESSQSFSTVRKTFSGSRGDTFPLVPANED